MAALKSVTRSTLREIQRVLPRQRAYTQDIKRVLNDKMQKAQKNFLDNFEKHPVTMEISAGASATNISGTLGGIGNLFSYIGFSAGSQPLAALRPLLTQYEIRYHHTKSKTIINITVPVAAAIFKVTPLPWASGRSWVKGIETGISGLGRYLYQDSANSRSGSAVQAKGRLRGSKFNNTSYLSSLLNDYYKEIRKIEKETLT
jgi:hypothetical protein